MLLIVFSNMLLVSATNVTDDNISNYSKEIEKIDKEINEITLKLKELESKNPNDEKIQEYKQRLKELIEKRHKLKLKDKKYNETLSYIQSEEYQKMQEEIWGHTIRLRKGLLQSQF